MKANKIIKIVRSLDSNYNTQKAITADDHKNKKAKGTKNKKSIFVTGGTDCKVFVKTFSGAKTTCMNNYVKPLVRSSSDHFIFHVGTNNLSLDKSSEEIARSIIDLTTSISNEKHDVSISNIKIRADNKKLEEKGVK